MATRIPKNIDPGRPISRPMAPVSKDAGWGKTLTKEELLGVIDRVYAKQEEKEMSKLTDTLKRALAKKQGKPHIEGAEGLIVIEKPTKKKKASPVTGKKPPTRSAGRGR